MSNGTWKISDIGRTLKNAGKAFLDGRLLLHFNEEKFFLHIVYTFLMFGIVIGISLAIEGTMAKEYALRNEIKELEQTKARKTFDLVTIQKRSEVAARLSKMGSAVGESEVKPMELN